MSNNVVLSLAVTIIVALVAALEGRQTLHNSNQDSKIASTASDLTVVFAENAALRARLDRLEISHRYLVNRALDHMNVQHEHKQPKNYGAPSETW